MSRTCRNAVRSILDWLQNIKYSFKRRKNSRNPVKVNATIYNIALSLKNPIFGLFGIHFFREIPLKTVAFIQFLPFIPHKKYPKSVAVRLFYKCCTYLENSAYYHTDEYSYPLQSICFFVTLVLFRPFEFLGANKPSLFI